MNTPGKPLALGFWKAFRLTKLNLTKVKIESRYSSYCENAGLNFAGFLLPLASVDWFTEVKPQIIDNNARDLLLCSFDEYVPSDRALAIETEMMISEGFRFHFPFQGLIIDDESCAELRRRFNPLIRRGKWHTVPELGQQGHPW